MYDSSNTKPTHWPRSPSTRAFLIITILQAIAVTAVESFILVKWETYLRPNAAQDPASRVVPTYITLLVFAALYSLAFVYDGLRRRSSVQVAVACALNTGLVVYAALQPERIRWQVTTIRSVRDTELESLVDLDMDVWADARGVLIALPCLVGVVTLLMAGLAWKIHGEFEWEVYRVMAGDPSMKRRFLVYQIYILLLKVDFFFIIGWIAQLVAQALDVGSVEFIVTLCAVPIIVAVGFLSHVWAARENGPGTIVTTVFHLAGLGYFIYKLTVMQTREEVRVTYQSGWTMLNIFAGASLALLILTIVNSIVCFRNFGKGLRMYLLPNEKTEMMFSHEPSALAYNPPQVSRLTLE